MSMKDISCLWPFFFVSLLYASHEASSFPLPWALCYNVLSQHSPWWPVETQWMETSETIAQTISFPLLDSLWQVVCPLNGRLTNIATLFKIVTICLCSLSSLSVPPIYTFEIFCSCFLCTLFYSNVNTNMFHLIDFSLFCWLRQSEIVDSITGSL